MKVLCSKSSLIPLMVAVSLLFFATVPSLSAYDPPPGGELIPSWYSPLFMGGGFSVTTESDPFGGPSADALNPASSASQQRFTLDTSYAALIGFGAEKGFGSVVNLGASIPKAYGVFGLGFRFFHVPSEFASMPLGTAFDWRGGFAKELGESLLVGMGISGRAGTRASSDWSMGADLGFIARAGDRGILKNLRWGAVLAGLGKWYAPGDEMTASQDIEIAFQSPYTLKAGLGFDLIKTSSFRLWSTGDLAFPLFQNVLLDLGLGMSIKEAFGLSLGWGLNLVELLHGNAKSILPSIGLQLSFPITTSKESGSFLASQGWDRSELRPVVGVQPLYNGVWGIGLGASMPLGVADKKPPKIMVELPETPYESYYLSPNADGKNDEIKIPIAISDERYVMEWSFTVVDQEGHIVREIRNKDERPEASGFKRILGQIASSKKGVPVPEEIVWDGRSDAGLTVPDGVYSIQMNSVDDNGNAGKSQAFMVSVDAAAPQAAIALPQDPSALVFSPDGDGKKDEILIPASGSVEDNWAVEVKNAAGEIVRRLDSGNAALGDIRWDGKDDAGLALPDGVYSIEVSSTDRGRNAVSQSVSNIVLDTAKTSVFLTAGASGFSPNADGAFDTLSYGLLVGERSGISTWALSIAAMTDGSVKRRFSGKAADLAESIVWDGKSDAGEVLPDGLYQGELQLVYINGSQPAARSSLVRIDTQAPLVGLSVSPSPFSPDNDGEADDVLISLSVADESGIDSWSLFIDEQAVSDTAAAGKTRRFMSWEGKGKPTEEIAWDGKSLKGELVEAASDYPCVLSVSDSLGNKANASAIVAVDILVVRDGERLKIKVPSIVFRPDFDDFEKLPAETVERNMKVLERIALTLNKYRNYKVRVEGHANNLGRIQGLAQDRIQKEEDGEVIPLSKKRAEAVKNFLVKFKVDAARLSTLGLGSSEPVVDPTDADNRWKNRRVEFILEKK